MWRLAPQTPNHATGGGDAAEGDHGAPAQGLYRAISSKLNLLVLCRDYWNIKYRDYVGILFPHSLLRTSMLMRVLSKMTNVPSCPAQAPHPTTRMVKGSGFWPAGLSDQIAVLRNAFFPLVIAVTI